MQISQRLSAAPGQKISGFRPRFLSRQKRLFFVVRIAVAAVFCVSVVSRFVSGVQTPPSFPEGVWVGRFESIPFASGNAMFRPIAILDGSIASARPGDFCSQSESSWRIQLSGLARRLEGQGYRPGACVLLQLDRREHDDLLSASRSLWSIRQRMAGRYRVVSAVTYLDETQDVIETFRLGIREQFKSLQEASTSRVSIPVILGLVTGDRALMKPWMWEIFARSGTSHLMSISGSHVTSLAALAYWISLLLLRQSVWLTRRVPAQQLAMMASLICACCYGMLAGMNVPTQRTLAMMTGAFLARVRGGSLLSWQALGLAAVAVVVVDPLAVIDVGAWLSFSAVAMIMLVSTGFVNGISVGHAWCRVQLALFIGLAPVSAAVFGGFSLVGPLANAVAIPLMGFLIVPGSLLLATILHLSTETATWLLLPLDWVVGSLFGFLQWISGWQWAMIRMERLDPWVAVFCCMAAISLLVPVSAPLRLSSLLLLTPAFMGPGFRQDADTTHVSVSRKWDVIIERSTHVVRVHQGAGAAAATSLQAWAHSRGYVLTRDPSPADWIKHGFAVSTYAKKAGAPGQLSLILQSIDFPCVSNLGRDGFTPLRLSELVCWLSLDWGEETWMLAGELDRSSQLDAAGKTWKADRLAVAPSSGQRLVGALLDNEGLAGIVLGWGTSASYQSQSDMLGVRSLAEGRWDATSLFACRSALGGWQSCVRRGVPTAKKIDGIPPVM